MKTSLAASALALGLLFSGSAFAREVTLTTQMKSYSGNNAYLVIYITDAQGSVQETLWMAGGSPRYYRHLRDWAAASGSQAIDGITGASVGSGRSLKVKVEIADALIDAGYQIRIDSAVEDLAEKPGDVSVSLDAASAGKAVGGRGYVKSFKFDM